MEKINCQIIQYIYNKIHINNTNYILKIENNIKTEKKSKNLLTFRTDGAIMKSQTKKREQNKKKEVRTTENMNLIS